MAFTHLQIRSGYSLMDSTITIDRLVKYANELNFTALALTDTNVLYGAIPFYKACQQYQIKPIMGMTLRVNNDADEGFSEIVLLAKDNIGYDQLIQISTYIQLNKLDVLPFEELEKYTKQLICILSVDRDLLDLETDALQIYLDSWRQLFSSGDMYIGVQAYAVEQDLSAYQQFKEMLHHLGMQAVAMNDVRYLKKQDDLVYDCLQAMKDGVVWKKQSSTEIKQRYFKNAAEMTSLFSFWPEVIEATEIITAQCNVIFDFTKRLIPSYPVPNGKNANDYLAELCHNNLLEKYPALPDVVKERLKYELSVIQTMDFSDYFLIVWDFIAYAKNNQITVGPGRGSAAGSLVAYLLNITDIDPIKYHLLFERFLNPERATMPDIDIDFSDQRRDDVIAYVRNKYGADHVAQIITFGTFAARSIVRELIKTMAIDERDAAFLLAEMKAQGNQTIRSYIESSENLKSYIRQSVHLKELFTIALKLEGLPRHISTHAAGVIISEKPLIAHVPLTIGANDTYLTQYPMNDLETIGLLKIDFLGLRNLTLIERIVKSIRYTVDKSFTLKKIPENDPLVFELLRSGQTNGIFQLESSGMKQVLMDLKPTVFADIVAVNALFRPGPMAYIPSYVNRKHDLEAIVYPHQDLEPILKETYGVLIYQEQIMEIAHKIAGFSLGKADILRRAVSKKNQDIMAEQCTAFISGCLNNGYAQEVAEEIFNWIIEFANYGFNKSHAVAYSRISYELAYLKANYPANFFAELLGSMVNEQDKAAQYIKEAQGFGIEVLPPAINKSFGIYAVEGKHIRMGFRSIKGISHQVVKEIIETRKSGVFKDLFDFCLRISLKTVNRQTLDLLITAGTFDETYANRASLLATVDQALEQGDLFKEFKDLPDVFSETIALEAHYEDIEDFTDAEKLANEKELLGIYMTSHPLKAYRNEFAANGYLAMIDLNSKLGKKGIKSVAMIQTIKEIRTKRGESMAFITLGDETKDMEAVIFPELYRSTHRWLTSGLPIVIQGKVEHRNHKDQLLLSDIQPFEAETFAIKARKRLFIKLRSDQDEAEALHLLRKLAQTYPGTVPIIIYRAERGQTYQLAKDYNLHPNERCVKELIAYFGEDNVVIE